MKKYNLWRIIWVIGIYIILVLTLYLVILYKVKWEDKDLNNYVYFYECSNELCTSLQEQKKYYSKIKCNEDICPYITEVNDNKVILSDNLKTWIYDYKNDNIISDNYSNYHIISDNYYTASSNGKYGIIDSKNNIVIDFKFDNIKDYNNGYVVYGGNNKYGIINNDRNIDTGLLYDDVVLINDKFYAYKSDNIYYIASYDTDKPVNNVRYNYIYANNDIILVAYDHKINLLNHELTSILLMTIDTYYNYSVGEERNSLNIQTDTRYIYFNVFTANDKYVRYRYDFVKNKLEKF